MNASDAKNHASQRVTVEIEYPRPYFDFPDLSSPDGNPHFYFMRAKGALQSHGFVHEGKEVEELSKTPYAQHFNILARFLDFNHQELTHEDEEFVYVKIRKPNDSTKQVASFKLHTLADIEQLAQLPCVEDSSSKKALHHFSRTNCYGRNHFFYLQQPDVVEYVLKQNEQHQWFDIFDLDVFNRHALHAKKDMRSFAILLNKMQAMEPELTRHFLLGVDIFGKNAFDTFLYQSGVLMGEPDKLCEQRHNKQLQDFGFGWGCVLKVLPEKKQQFFSIMEDLQDKNPAIKKKGIYPLVMESLLEADAPVSDKPMRRSSKI